MRHPETTSRTAAFVGPAVVGPASTERGKAPGCKPPEGGATMARLRSLSIIACFCFASGIGAPCIAAEPREVHGSADAFSAPGAALAWGILRGVNEAATLVIVRIVVDPGVFASVTVVGSDPFTQRQQALPYATPSSGRFELRMPRPHFADFPRTELRFSGSERATGTDPPKLVVFYLGVPDTTPEFASEAALDAYLTDRIARIRANTGSKAP